jgi:hypothetical protein
MARKTDRLRKDTDTPVDQERAVARHAGDTPLWDKYYQEMRKRIRFPRYYKRALNW